VPPLASNAVEYVLPTVPEGNELVVICSGLPAATMLKPMDCVALCAISVLESVTWKVTLETPAPVGVPEIVPVVERVRPAGKEPELTLQLYGVTPPVADNVAEYAVPTCPEGTEVLLI
jgi:hypothetical protein